MSDVFDLDNIADQADGVEPFQFRFGGEDFTCTSPNNMDIRDLGRLLDEQANNPAAMLHFMLGDEQWGRLEQVDAVFSAAHLKALTEAWLGHYGLDVGKPGGSAVR